jgi:hypothetical protein
MKNLEPVSSSSIVGGGNGHQDVRVMTNHFLYEITARPLLSGIYKTYDFLNGICNTGSNLEMCGMFSGH